MLTRAEFEVLAAGLNTDPLPPAPFMAAPWLEVGDRERYLLMLRTALRQGPSAGVPW